MKKFITIGILLLMAGCGSTSLKVPTNSMTFDNISYIDKFPISIQLSGGGIVNIGSTGCSEFTIQDSMIILNTRSQSSIWAFYSLPDHKHLGSYLQMGHANSEFVSPPYFSSSTFFKENNNLYVAIRDFNRGAVHKMNITETLRNDALSISLINDSVPRNLFNFIYIDDTKYLIQEIDNQQTRQTRSIYNNGNRELTKNLDKLNLANVEPRKDYNLLSTGMGYNPDRTLIVEAPIKLNHINLYALDDSFNKTICLGEKVDDIDILQVSNRMEEMYQIMSLQSYKDFFCVLYLNDLNINFESGKEKNPSIQFFNWKGEPLAEIKLERQATEFAIDTINKCLYITDFRTEEIFQYNISNLLSKIQ